ncbi:Heterokaryon incompatibility protein [Hyphodiscus hymeniophilus]|uniref:Heterokaryon incompatibility protein n=1 Tax=Hyphodiscus hymeniophilus TaxID=353542 RepID=A0A9P7AZ79_9HELO|nr:Heterokaryon incompatibility protein [Hyphodiscus hymeniophilus]
MSSSDSHILSDGRVYGPPLKGENIRLLTFKKGTGKHSLNLDLTRALLPQGTSDDVRYIALSYIWGHKDDPTKEIIVNGRPFQVKIKLERALIHLEAEPEINLPVWIDAVCINQENEMEKNEQVAQMRDIYEKATRTVVWLGESDISTERVFARLDKVGKKAIAAGLSEFKEEDLKQWPDFGSDKAKIKIKEDVEKLFPTLVNFPLKSLIEISERPWFTRVWVVQELALSTEIVFMCGKWKIPGEHFVTGYLFCLLWMAHELRPLREGGSLFDLAMKTTSICWRNGRSFIPVFFGLFKGESVILSPRAGNTLGTRRGWQSGNRLTLKAQLCRAFTIASTVGLDATDPRDRIYALLGIVDDLEKLGIDIKKFINYGKDTTPQSLYMNVAKILLQNGHIDILCLCRPANVDASQTDGLPTWAPDWSTSLLPPWSGYLEDKLFNASGEDTASSELSVRSQIRVAITLKARSLGSVSDIGSSWNSGWKEEFDFAKVGRLLLQLTEFLQSESSVYSPDEQNEAFWRIPIGDKEFNDLGLVQRATSQSKVEFQDLLNVVLKKQRLDKVPNMASYTACMKDMHNAMPFISSDGYVGLCPNVSKIDDEIFIPLGSHVPLIFRKAENASYKVVGEAYVYGMMEGEVLQLATSRTLELTLI